MKQGEKVANSHVLVAVDESESSLRAVAYVGEMLNDLKELTVYVIHIINEPEQDFFRHMKEKEGWIADQKAAAEKFLNHYRDVLMEKGISEEKIVIQHKVRYCPSVAECILTEKNTLNCKTVVIGRKGVSREEEFLFGSVSNKIIHQARNCTVWVVE